MPVPEVVHNTWVASPPSTPFSCTVALLAQKVMSAPASTVPKGRMSMCRVSASAGHTPVPVAVSTRSTPSARESCRLAWYTLLSALAGLAKVPLPSVLHCPVVPAPVTDPLITTSRSSKQVTRSAPASTADSGTMVTVIWSCALSQLFTLQVKVSVPRARSVLSGQ